MNKCKPAGLNMLSADINPQVVSDYLQEEVKADRIIGSLKQGSVVGMQTSLFGVIPKGHTPGKWRLIVDLSNPQGSSVNDGIPKEACSVTYITCDEGVGINSGPEDQGPGTKDRGPGDPKETINPRIRILL